MVEPASGAFFLLFPSLFSIDATYFLYILWFCGCICITSEPMCECIGGKRVPEWGFMSCESGTGRLAVGNAAQAYL